ELIIHDAKPLIEFWLARGVTPPAIHDSAVAAYLLNSARQSYRLEQVCIDALDEYPPAADPSRAFGVRADFAWRYWEHAAAELRARELWPIYEEIERPLVPVLALMERHGTRVDPARPAACAKAPGPPPDKPTREPDQLAGFEPHEQPDPDRARSADPPGVHSGGRVAIRRGGLLADRAADPRAPLGGAGADRVVRPRRGHPHADRVGGVQGAGRLGHVAAAHDRQERQLRDPLRRLGVRPVTGDQDRPE